MEHKNTEIVLPYQNIDLRASLKKNASLAMNNFLQDARQPAKNMAGDFIDWLLNKFSDWVNRKL